MFPLSTQALSCAFGATLKVPESDSPSVALLRRLMQSLLSLSMQAQSCALQQLTSSGRVWPKLLESDARSVALPQLTQSLFPLSTRAPSCVLSATPRRIRSVKKTLRPPSPALTPAMASPRPAPSSAPSTLVSAWASALQYSFFYFC